MNRQDWLVGWGPQDIEAFSTMLVIFLIIDIVVILSIVGLFVYGLFFWRPYGRKPLGRTFPRAPTKVK